MKEYEMIIYHGPKATFARRENGRYCFSEKDFPMAKQDVYSEQYFWVLRRENGILFFYEKDRKPYHFKGKSPFGYIFYVDDENFLPFIKKGEKPALCEFRLVSIYNFKLRANVERGIVTRNTDGVLFYESVSYTEQDIVPIYYPDFLKEAFYGIPYNVEIIKLC